MSFGERLKKIRKSNGLTQEEFAAKIGVTRSPIAASELGKSKLQTITINRICELFDINQDWLLTGNGQMHNTFDIPEDELKQLISVYSKLPESSREKFLSLLIDLQDS